MAAASCSGRVRLLRVQRASERHGSRWGVGAARVFARPLVEATVEVRNAFGNSRAITDEIALPFELDSQAQALLMPHEAEVTR